MPGTALIGALLVVVGLLYTALAAVYRGRMSEPHSSPRDPADVTLEPRQSGLRSFSLKNNWPGLLIAAIGLLLLLLPVVLAPAAVAPAS
jgi:hypothetical protein